MRGPHRSLILLLLPTSCLEDNPFQEDLLFRHSRRLAWPSTVESIPSPLRSPPRSYSEVVQARPPNAHEVLRANSGRARPMSVTVSSVVPISISVQNLSVVKKSPTDVPEAVNSEPSSEDETSDDRKTDEEEHQWTTVQRKKSHGRRTMSPRPSRPPVPNMLSPKRAKAVREAERLLSTPQRETMSPPRCKYQSAVSNPVRALPE